MKPTIQDVAQRSGVSKTTVSYVLNGRGESMRIPNETRQRILSAMRDLDYHPNGLARGLAHRRTDTVAIVMQFPAIFSGGSGFTSELMHGVTDAACALGYDVMLRTRQPDERWQKEGAAAEVAALTDGRIDGALLLRDVDDPLAESLHLHGFPTVQMFTRTGAAWEWYVDCDNLRGAELAVKHLISMGHRRIVHLAGPVHSAAAIDRRAGFDKTLRLAGIDARQEWMVEAPYTDADFGPALHLFDAPAGRRPTAVFAWSDDVAIAMMRHLRARGLRVPQDVAVVGFDSTVQCDQTDPPLTSVRQPIYEMTKSAFALLVDRIGGNTPESTQICVDPEIVVRRSCGALRA